MKIAIIGIGNVGSALARGFAKTAHKLVLGVRNTGDAAAKALGAEVKAELASPAEAAKSAEVIILALPWNAAEAAVKALGDLSGKIVIDCTNPLRLGADGLELALGYETSGGEMVASWAKGAAVFKSLNQTGAENMEQARRFLTRPVMFVAGDDAAKKPTVLALVAELGFEAADAGPLRMARLLEPFGMLWIDQALRRGRGPDFALASTRRSA